MRAVTRLLIVFTLAFTSYAAQAGFVNFAANISGAPSGSPGSGGAGLSLNTSSNTLAWAVNFEGLLGPATSAGFYGPPPGSANLQVDIGLIDLQGLGNTSGIFLGAAALTEFQASDLLAGQWFVSISSDQLPGGEIFGKIKPLSAVPLPAAMWMFLSALGVLGIVAKRRRPRTKLLAANPH